MAECIFCNGEYDKKLEKCTNDECGLSNQPRLLVDKEILKLLKMNVIKISPMLMPERQVSPFGIDLTLDTRFKKIIKSNEKYIDPIEPYSSSKYYEDVELSLALNETFVLHPGDFTLGQSFEFISLPNFIAAGLDGKSSLGRLSLTVHTTAASIDQGFKGHITFELFNGGGLPIVLHPLMPVARVIFHLTSRAERTYSGDYMAQTEVRPSMYYKSKFSKILLERQPFLP